jgi:hypothetical protein
MEFYVALRADKSLIFLGAGNTDREYFRHHGLALLSGTGTGFLTL